MTNSLSPEQLAQRLAGITATDIAAIVGVHPYRSAVDVWSEKRGTAPPFEGNDRTKWGQILEPVIRKDYEERHGVRVELRGTMTSRDKAWMMATPDGLVFQPAAVEADRGLEIKCHTVYLSHLYGEPGTDEVPPYELCQCTWGMAITGLPRWDLVPFIDGQTNDYVIDRDDDLIEVLIERAERFRVDNVLGGEPPPPDGSKAYTEWLAAVHKADNAEAQIIAVDADPTVLAAVGRLRELRDEIAALEAEEGIKVQAIKAVIANRAGIEFPSTRGTSAKGKPAGSAVRDKITWKKAKDGIVRTYAATFEAVRSRARTLTNAKAPDVQRAITALDKLAEQTFANSRATISAAELRELIAGMFDTLRDIAVIEAGEVAAIGTRRFVVPKHWKTSTKSDAAA